jgi:hypothetical protein
VTFFFLAALGAVTRAFGDFRDPVYGFATAILVGFMWRGFPDFPGFSKAINWLLRWSTWALMVGALAVIPAVLRVTLLTAALWFFDQRSPGEHRGRWRALVLTGVFYSIWWTVFFQLPIAYHWLTEWSYAYTHTITQTMSARLYLGPSASAVDLLLLGICGIVAATLCSRPRNWVNAIIWMVALEAGRIIYIWMAPTLLGMISHAIPVGTTPQLDLPWIYFLFLALIITQVQPGREPAITPRTTTRKVTSSRPVVIALGLLLLACFIAGAASYDNRPVRILFLNRNTLDMGVPVHGRYGDRSGGMFGFLPLFLQACGNVAVRDSITKEVLDSVDVIFIANLLQKIPPDERQLIWDFVDRGGGLLIVGDHTGTDAIREPTNDLLSPCGMELNFDTAVPLRRSWASAKSYLFHPLGRSGGVMDAELWLGASITCGPHGEPFVVGRGAFSDPGDITNKTRSYLGNLAYDPGEKLGDVVLAAAAHWGKGKAVLHGDTSPYQNGTIIRSHSMINRTLHWLVEDGFFGFVDRWREWLLMLAVGVAGTILAVLSLNRRIWLLTALLLPAVSVGLWSLIPGTTGPDAEWVPKNYKQALVDEGHGSLFDMMSWEQKSIGGLQYNLMRNGLSPRFAESPMELDCAPASMYVIATPTLPFSAEETDRLVSFAENGGWVLVSAGWNTYPNVKGIFDRFGVALENVPLGQSDGTAKIGTVKMADAYPVVGDTNTTETLVECLGYPVAKAVHRGRGGLIAIGDSQFLLNKNLEGQNEMVVMENVQFFRDLMESTTHLAVTP